MTGEPSIIPIKDYTYPKEGKRSLQYTVDLSNQAAVVDLVNIAQMGQMSQIPSIFFDNADNDFSVTIVMEGTFQRIVCPPKSQGYIRLLLPQKPRLGFSSEQPCQFKVNFLNFVVEELTIWKVSDVSGGTVTSVGLNMPVEFDVTGSPITSAGTFGVTWASELANKVFAAPNGAPGIPSFRSLVAADIPALNYVTSVGLAMPSIFSVANSPITGAGTFTVTLNNENANTFFIGPGSGAAATPTFRTLVTADLNSIAGQIPGEPSNGNANAGNAGEYIFSRILVGSAVTVPSVTVTNITSIVLTPGDWDVSAGFGATGSGTVQVGLIAGTINTSPTTLSNLPGNQFQQPFPPGFAPFAIQDYMNVCGPVRFSVSVNTTIYMNIYGNSTASFAGYGILRARRVR